MSKTFYAWAIDTHSKEGHGFIGRYYWFSKLPDSSEGCAIALFTTRAKARKYLEDARQGFPKAQVVKVRVTVVTA